MLRNNNSPTTQESPTHPHPHLGSDSLFAGLSKRPVRRNMRLLTRTLCEIASEMRALSLCSDVSELHLRVSFRHGLSNCVGEQQWNSRKCMICFAELPTIFERPAFGPSQHENGAAPLHATAVGVRCPGRPRDTCVDHTVTWRADGDWLAPSLRISLIFHSGTNRCLGASCEAALRFRALR